MMQPVGFTSAASALIQTASGGASTYFMPPIDPGNVDTQVSVPTGVTAYVNFAPGVQVGPDVPGCLIVKGGYPVLLTANAAAIAAAAQGGRVLARTVTTHQERAASGPLAGTTGFDGRQTMTPPGQINA